MKKKCGTCDKIGHVRSVCQSKGQQNAGGQGSYNKQPKNAKGQQVKQGGNKQPGIQSGGTNVKDEPKTEENPTHQQALDYWKIAHQVKEMGGTSITIPTEGRQATFAEVVKFGQDHSNWKEGDPILWRASDLIRTQNLAMGGSPSETTGERKPVQKARTQKTPTTGQWCTEKTDGIRGQREQPRQKSTAATRRGEQSKRHRQRICHGQPNS